MASRRARCALKRATAHRAPRRPRRRSGRGASDLLGTTFAPALRRLQGRGGVRSSGAQSHAADIIVYDALNAPLIRSGDITLVPDAAVYGVIEVTETLDKEKLEKDHRKIVDFKLRSAAPLQGIDFADDGPFLRAAPRPFGMVVGFGGTALETLKPHCQKLIDESTTLAKRGAAVPDSQRERYGGECVDLAVVLGDGLIHLQNPHGGMGRQNLLTSDAVAAAQLVDTVACKISRHTAGALGEFFVRLNNALAAMALLPVTLNDFCFPPVPIFDLSAIDDDA